MGADLLSNISTVAQSFLQSMRDNPQAVKIVGNLDTDGITSTSILLKALAREGIPSSVSIIKQINKRVLTMLNNEPYQIVFFVDLGSGYIEHITKELHKKVYIIDHHIPDVRSQEVETITHINPHLFNIDGTTEISAAGVTYLFAKSLNPQNQDLAYLALIGAIGDIQEQHGFIGLNNKILEDALASKKITVEETFRFYGLQTKALHKVLEYTTNPFLSGITGNEKGALSFLESVGIKTKNDGKFRKFNDLSTKEKEQLLGAIESKTTTKTNEAIIGPVYLLADEPDTSVKKDLREFSTLLNSCGRMNKAGLGIGVCLGDTHATKQALIILREYRKEVIDALRWFHKHRTTEKIEEHKQYTLIIAENNIRDTIIGTLASILSKSNVYSPGTIIVSTAYTLDGKIKASLRISGKAPLQLDLRDIVKKAISPDMEGYGGGHRLAAGAVISQEHEEAFLGALRNALEGSSENKLLLEKEA